MPFDYTDAPPPQFELIPQDTIAGVSTHIRAGNAGEDGLLKRSTSGECEMLDLEFTVLDGTYKGRKFWHNLLLSGTTDGQKKMAAGNLGVLKAILDSALGLKPDDVSAEARARRTVSLKQFEGMCFIAKVGVEKGAAKTDGGGGFWPDKNCLAGVITPDKTAWKPVEQPPPFDAGSSGGGPSSSTPSTPAAPVERPDWA
jgi:hypothetical protein